MSCKSLAECSLLGVGMKFSPLESSDVSPGIRWCLLRLMMWVRVLLNLLWCFVFSVAVVFVWPWSIFTVLFFLFKSCIVSLDIFSMISYILFHCAGDVSSLTLFLIGSSSSLNLFALSIQ